MYVMLFSQSSNIAVGSDRYYVSLLFRGLWFSDVNITGKAVYGSATGAFDLQLDTIPITTEQFVALLAPQIFHYYSPPLNILLQAYFCCRHGKMRAITIFYHYSGNPSECIQCNRILLSNLICECWFIINFQAVTRGSIIISLFNLIAIMQQML